MAAATLQSFCPRRPGPSAAHIRAFLYTSSQGINLSEMNLSTVKWFVGLVALIFLTCCFGVPWWINHLLIARLDGPSFNTDQVLASLGVMVTGLGLFVALAAVGIAVLAVIGYTELRSTVERRIVQLESLLHKKGLLVDDDLKGEELRNQINPRAETKALEVNPFEATTQTAGAPKPELTTEGNLPEGKNEVATGAEQPIAGEYPKGKEDKKP